MFEEREILSKFNGILKENDDIYRNAAKKMGISDCAFWIFYCLREKNKSMTQKEICDLVYIPKQTVNSSLKKLEADGYICSVSGEDRRSRLISLTRKGEAFCEGTVDLILNGEMAAFKKMSLQEQEVFLELLQKYTDHLKDAVMAKQKDEVCMEMKGEDHHA